MKNGEPPCLIFLSLSQIDSLNDHGIYHDLLRQFVVNGFKVVIVCAVERRTRRPTNLLENGNVEIIQVKTLNIQKSNLFEKGIATISINFLFKRAINQFLKNQKIDLILYATPPVTISKIVSWLKQKHSAKTYLLLKDIFPQNAVDLKMIRPNSFLHKFFMKHEKLLYSDADMIGCMSPANKDYILSLYPELLERLEVNPNSIEILSKSTFSETRKEVFDKLEIPLESTVFIYGGNLGKPQGAIFLTKIINICRDRCPNAFFLIIGSGTEYGMLNDWFIVNKPSNAKLLPFLSKNEYDKIIAHADVGLILLRREFTVPNFPSRLLSYLENKLPVLCIIDLVTDIGLISEIAGFGRWSEYGDVDAVTQQVIFFHSDKKRRQKMGELGLDFLCANYDVRNSYEKINNFFRK